MILACGDDLAGIRNRALLLFLLSSGARREGVATLTVDRLNLAKLQATVIEKGNKPRVVAFDQLTAQALYHWLEARQWHEFVFYNLRRGTPLTGSGIRQIIRKLAAKHGIEGANNPHGWRHLFAELYHQSGGSIASLSKLLGHSSTFVTATTYLNFGMQTALDEYRAHDPMAQVADLLNQKSATGRADSEN